MPKIWEHLPFVEIKKLNKSKIVFLPIGAIEAHGRHLPVASDSIIAKGLSEYFATIYDGILGPLVNFGPCETMINFHGTITISEKTLKLLLQDIITSICHHGFNRICIINGHGGNNDVLKSFWSRKNNLRIMTVNWYDQKSLSNLKKTNKNYLGDHADRAETEMLLLLAERLVNLKEAIDNLAEWPVNLEELDDYSEIMKQATDGFPSKSKILTANKLWEDVIKDLKKEISSFFEL